MPTPAAPSPRRLLLALAVIACGCTEPPGTSTPCSQDSECAATEICLIRLGSGRCLRRCGPDPCPEGWTCLARICRDATCDNGVRDGQETGVDCGGWCPDCPPLRPGPCDSGADCRSGFCTNRQCETCADNIRNQDETDIDCGGRCPLCGDWQGCGAGSDCASGFCVAGRCQSCQDGRRGQGETDVDCGGRCPPCRGGYGCAVGRDCQSGICERGRCLGCGDGVKNFGETDIDCGGPCWRCFDGASCRVDADCERQRCLNGVCVSCEDQRQNADETDVDCGGAICKACPAGLRCLRDGDCLSGACVAGACGAPCRVKPCQFGQPCAANGDCRSGRCSNAHCAAPASCANQIRDRRETDVDCGGGDCPPCGGAKACQSRDDCEVVGCLNGRCAHCGDGRRNGDESDLDCGGSCGACKAGQACRGDADCAMGTCQQARCATCSDGLKNQRESDVDCGGACIRCGMGKRCNAGSDCLSGACSQGLCAAGACTPACPGGTYCDKGRCLCDASSCAGCCDIYLSCRPTGVHECAPRGELCRDCSFDPLGGGACVDGSCQPNGHGCPFLGDGCVTDRFACVLWRDQTVDQCNGGDGWCRPCGRYQACPRQVHGKCE